MKIYDGKNFELHLDPNEPKKTFYCPECQRITEDISVHVIYKDSDLLASYHKDCVKTLIYEDRNGGHIPPKEKVGFIKPSENSLSIDKKTYLDELSRFDEKPKLYISSIIKKEASIHLIGENKIGIFHPYDLKILEKYKFYKKFKFNKPTKMWEIYIKSLDYEILNFIMNIYKTFDIYDWTIDQPVIELIKKKNKEIKEKTTVSKEIRELKKMLDLTDIDPKYDFDRLKKPPFGYQKVGISFLDKIGGVGLIGDEPGVGKTFSAIGYTTLFDLITVIVCPASLKYNWFNEINRFTHKKALVISEVKPETLNPKNLEYDYYIINYEQLDKYAAFFLKAKFDCVVLDESQYISTLKSKRTKAVMKFFKKTPKRILLSGTPVKNRPLDFYAQLKFLRPDIFSQKENYGLRYCDAKKTEYGWDYSGASNLDELQRKISPFYIRRTKKEVLKDLPEKTISLRYIEMLPAEKKAYKAIDDAFFKYNKEKNKLEDQEKPLDGKQLALITELSQWCAKNKTKYLIEFINNFLETTESRKIIVFSRFIETQNILKNAFLKNGVSIMGDDKDIERQKAVDRFQTDPNIRVFIGSTKAAGVGLTLTAADTVIFNDILYTPTDHEQAEDRAHRVGQKDHVNVYYFLFKESIEEKIFNILNYKQGIITQIVDNKKDDIVYQEENVLKSLVNSYLAKT